MTVADHISHGQTVSRGWVWRFWKADEVRLEESLEALDRIEQSAREEGNTAISEATALTKQCLHQIESDRHLDLLRHSFDQLAAGVADGACALAGFALRLAENEGQLLPYLQTEMGARQPGWEANFLEFLSARGMDSETALQHLAKPDQWNLQTAAQTVLEHPEARIESVPLLRQLESSPLFEIYDQLHSDKLERPLTDHLLRTLVAGEEPAPLDWVKPLFKSLKKVPQRRQVADWAMAQLAATPWASFASQIPVTSVGLLTAYYQGEQLTPGVALRVVADHLHDRPELLSHVKVLAEEQKQVEWSKALELLEQQPPNLRRVAMQHLLGQGLDQLERRLITASIPGPERLVLARQLLETAPDSRVKSLLVSLKQVPMSSDSAGSEVLGRGVLLLHEEESPTRALLACKASDATSNISDKFSVLQQAIADIHEELPEGWGRRAFETAWELSHLEADKNQLWLRTAAAHHSLRILSQGLPSDEFEFLAFGRQLLRSQWMIPAWYDSVLKAVARGLSHSDNPILAEKLMSLETSDPSKVLQGLTEFKEITDLSDFLLADSSDDVHLSQGEGFWTIGDFEIPIQDEEVGRKLDLSPARWQPDTERQPQTLVPDFTYTEQEREQEVTVRKEVGYKRGQALVYNPAEGEFVHEQGYKRGVGGGYRPVNGEVHFEQARKRGVGAVYLPEQGELDIREAYKRGIAGLHNTVTGNLEFQKKYKGGVAAAFDPYTGEERWKQGRNRGQSGYYDLKSENFVFESAHKRGIALATNDPGHPTLTTSSSFSYNFDDD